MVKQNKIQENNFNKSIFNRVNQKRKEISWSYIVYDKWCLCLQSHIIFIWRKINQKIQRKVRATTIIYDITKTGEKSEVFQIMVIWLW